MATTRNRNGNDNPETPEAPETNESTATEANDADEQVQVLFKVSKLQRNQLKVVAMLENADGLQDLFSGVARDLIGKHEDALTVLFARTESAA